MRNYTIISGTGRAGTTLLVRLLTTLGFDTGFPRDKMKIDPIANAGLERNIRSMPDCKIVKSPWIADYIEQVLANNEIEIDHAIICMRSLSDAAESRRSVQAKNGHNGLVPGGLCLTANPEDQEEVLALLFYKLIFNLSLHSIPITFLHFPRFTYDVDYLAQQLKEVFGEIDHERLRAALESEVRPELISDFSRSPSARR